MCSARKTLASSYRPLSFLICIATAAMLAGCQGLVTGPHHQDTLTVALTGSGTVTSQPAGINCGTACSAVYAAATSITLTATPATGYAFTGWSGACTGTAACTVVLTSPTTAVTATFVAQNTLTVTLAGAGQGTVTSQPAGINCGTTCSAVFSDGTTVTLTATPATGFVFAGWSGACSGTSATCSLTLSGGTTAVTATFAASLKSIQHVIFMMQENRTFDHYFGMLNPYRAANGWNIGDDGKTYNVDGIDDKLSTISNTNDEGQSFKLFKLSSTCIDDDSSAWIQSYGDVNTYDFAIDRPILMNGFVHVAENFAKDCLLPPGTQCTGGTFTDVAGQRPMGYYDQGYLNYYYYMASQFALSDRWFSPMSSETIPNRIATLSGGTTQGLTNDPGANGDQLGVQLSIPTIFQELDTAGTGASWKIYYGSTADGCPSDVSGTCNSNLPINKFPNTTFSYFSYSATYLHSNSTACAPPTQPSGTAVGDPANSFCIDPSHIAPLQQFFTDLQNNTLPNFVYIEPQFGISDEHPGSGQSILSGQAEVASIINGLMASSSYANSVFFFTYDEGGGPYDHVPPVPNHTNDFTDASLGITTDISSIAVNPDSYPPCLPPNPPGTPTLHCDLKTTDPGANPGDAAAQQGFAAQLGFRLPNIIVSPYVRKHYVSHTPMDHTAVIKFVENLFIGPGTNLTLRDAAQPDLSEFFDFVNEPWKTPPTPPTATPTSQAAATCHADSM